MTINADETALPSAPLLVVGPRNGLRSGLTLAAREHVGCPVVPALSVSRVLALARRRAFAAAVVELMPGEGELAAVVEALREALPTTPVLLITDEDLSSARETAPAHMSTMTRPVRVMAVLSWVQRHVRGASPCDGFAIGRFQFEPRAKLLQDMATSAVVRLTEKEATLLELLHRATPDIISREELLGKVWGYRADIMTHTLETHIYRLRQKIEADPGRAEILICEPGGGYRLALNG